MQCLDCKKHNCNHYRVDFRQYPGEPEARKIEGCVFHLIYDELKNWNRRSAMMHSEQGQMKNVMALLAVCLNYPEHKEELTRQLESCGLNLQQLSQQH